MTKSREELETLALKWAKDAVVRISYVSDSEARAKILLGAANVAVMLAATVPSSTEAK